jgi:hypothetical protein
MSMSLLLLLLTLSAATMLAFGMVLRLLLGPTRLLIREVLVAALPLYSKEFVSVLLLALATRAHVLQLILSQDCIMDMGQLNRRQCMLLGHNGHQHFPFLGQGRE